MENEIETIETLPEGAIAMRPVQGPDGGYYLIPDTSSQEAASKTADAAIEAGPDLLAWARPVLDDPVGWAQANLLNLGIMLPIIWQVAAIFGALFLGIVLSPSGRKLVLSGLAKLPGDVPETARQTASRLVRPALWAGFLYSAQALMATAGLDSTLVRITVSLAIAWLLIRFVTAFLPKNMRRTAGWLIWTFAALYAFELHDEAYAWLSGVGPGFGGRVISPVFVVYAMMMAALFMYGAHWTSKKLKTRVDTMPKVEPSLRILLGNALQIGLFFGAAMLTMAGLGISTSGLTVLGGAIGVGLGFGMQQIVANFVSGVILLTERSIKPEDVIEVDDTYGVVKSLGLRYASVVTRDGKEHLIPNEKLITDTVVNWSFTDKKVRIKRRLRVEYETDLRTACELVVQGVSEVARVLKDPAPKCLVMEFGEEAVEIEARFWIDDPENGINGVGSEAMLSVWDKFKQAGIDIPMRHEDILITPGSTLKVEMVPPGHDKD